MGKRRKSNWDMDLYDTSDVKFDFKDKRSRREVHLIARSDSDLNLLKYALSLRLFLERIENELGFMDAAEGEH